MDFGAVLSSIKLFADGASIDDIRGHNQNPLVSGFTTNPTLMRKAGVKDYIEFAREVVSLVHPKPVSLEVFAAEFDEMQRQALAIKALGSNVFVKIPITNARGESSIPLIRELSASGTQVNVTAIFTEKQVFEAAEAVKGGPAGVISVFAGRIADSGVDPVPLMKRYASELSALPTVELLWASPREVLNVIQAAEVGCDIITMTSDLWSKLSALGKPLERFSLETVQMFDDDAKASRFWI